MQTITYRDQPQLHRTLVNVFFALTTLAVVAWTIYRYWQSGGAEWDLFGPWLILLLWVVHLFGTRHAGRISLTLDDEGLTYAIGRTSRRRAWTALSRPEIYSRGGRLDPYIRFRSEKLDWIARLTWVSWRTRPEIRIPFTYDAPLTDICAKLNEYRDRALGAGRRR